MLKTDRFVLKQLSLVDANEKYLCWFNDDEIKKFILNRPKCIGELEKFINHCNDDNTILLLGIFTQDNIHIGNIKYEFFNASYDKASMGIMIGLECWRNKGVGTEVIEQSIKYLSQQFNTNSIELGVDVTNVAAVQVYKKLGFQITKVNKGDPDGLIMTLDSIR